MVSMKLIDITRLPPYFTRDSEEREIFKHDSDTHCTEAELRVLLSDAEFYCHKYGPDECPKGLKASARAVIRRCRQILGGYQGR
jgi:hypothetical protein